ncbi:MAG: GNAT family N-acetyltransferase [Rhodobacteraceae bacterium]|nr:GNAT family N-acetyltransferase [Paracoccaceae bacterium]
MSVQIRPIDPGDRANWSDLWRAYLAFYGTDLPDALYHQQFARLTSRVPSIHGLVADRDGTLVGLVHYLYHPHGWKSCDVCYLQDLYVTPEARGTGLGRALIEAVYAAADTHGTPDVYWTTQDFNAEARHLYDRVGVVTPFIKYQRA